MKSKASILITALMISVFFIIGGVLLLFGGAYIGATLEDIYVSQHKPVPEWTLILSVAICAIGVLGGLFGGIVAPILHIVENSGTPIEQPGKIIEIIKRNKNGSMIVLVEFSDRSRKELIAERKFHLSTGDEGFVGAQGKYIRYFNRNTQM